MAVAAVRTALEVGHWPSYGNPDPKDVVHRLGSWVAWLDLLGLIAPGGMARVGRHINLKCPPRIRLGIAICVTFVIGFTGIALHLSDPGDIGTWWMD